MTQTVTALYDRYDSAVSAVNALEASGVSHSDISIVSNNVDNRYTNDRPTNAAEDAAKGAGIGAAVGGVGGLLTGVVDLPRFRGEMRAWDQALGLYVMLSSGFVAFFGSAPGGAILPSRPVH